METGMGVGARQECGSGSRAGVSEWEQGRNVRFRVVQARWNGSGVGVWGCVEQGRSVKWERDSTVGMGAEQECVWD